MRLGRLIHLIDHLAPEAFSEESVHRAARIGSEAFPVSIIVALVGIIDRQQRSVLTGIAAELVRMVLGQPGLNLSYRAWSANDSNSRQNAPVFCRFAREAAALQKIDNSLGNASISFAPLCLSWCLLANLAERYSVGEVLEDNQETPRS